MRRRLWVGLALGLGLVLPATAHGTATLELRYAPPVISFIDANEFKTTEDLRLGLLGPDFLFQNPPAHFALSKGGCDFDFDAAGYTCPRTGIERIVARLGHGDDKARTTIRGYSQKFNGGSGDDQLKAGGGKQRLLGGTDDDVLSGGKGGDVIIGGPGEDICRGGPGRDVVKGCE
jgi:Ca2+-binding RTX toxin-like protein